MATLLEKYSDRVRLAEKWYAKKNGGAQLNADKKMALVQVLSNESKFLNEAFENSVSTQRSDIGNFKKFVMDITTIVLPTLIGTDLVITHPMTAFTGTLTYMQYVKGSTKGASTVGDLINNPFKLGTVDPTYTSSTVVENETIADSKITLKWGPVIPGSIAFQVGDDKYFDADGKLYKGTFATKRFVVAQEDANGRLEGVAGHFEVDPGTAVQVGTVTYGYPASKAVNGAIYDAATPVITFTSAPETSDPIAVNYVYNNVAIMQNDIPMLTAQRKAITLEAKFRRIAVQYSNIAAYQQKLEYGQDLGKDLEVQAVSQLKYEIDTEIVDFLVANATVDPEITFNAVERVGVSLAQQYEGFSATIDRAREKMYTATQKYNPNYMICARSIVTILQFLPGFKAAPKSVVSGPYFAG